MRSRWPFRPTTQRREELLMPYNPALVAPMREEMVRLGARELKRVDDGDGALGDQQGTMLVFVNSVCGCAAGNARPALRLALEHSVLPEQLVTVFAGQDLQATARARQFFSDYQPSSPSMALLRDGEVVHFVHRHQIEGRSPQSIAADLTSAFDRFCGAAV